MKVKVLGINIDDINLTEAKKMVEGWLKSGGKHYIVTPNPEFLVKAYKDPDFKKVLNEADLAIPDGIGLKLFGGVKNRVAGVDLMEQLIKLSEEKGYTVGFLGGKNGVAKKAAECLRQRYQNISVTFTEDGGEIDENGMEYFVSSIKGENKKQLNTQYHISDTDLLFVAFGHGKQEKWIAKNLHKIPVKVTMGVGGSFDYLSGTVPRAPKLIRKLGFEWLFRLIIEPWRIKRQFDLLIYLYLLLKRA